MSTDFVVAADRLHRDRSFRDWLLFMLTVSSGAVDAISFLALGKVFTAFMTGNIVFLGLGIALVPSAPSVVSVLTAIAGFGLGIYFATHVVNPKQTGHFNIEKKTHVVWPVRATRALAASLLPHLGFVALWITAGGKPDHDETFVLLALWAIAMGIQSAAVRHLDVGGIYTTAATATFIFLVGDLARYPITGEERFRLTGVLLSLLIGATVGGSLVIHALTYAPIFSFVMTAVVVALAVKAFEHHEDGNLLPNPER